MKARGFTLIEVLVAMALVLVLVAAAAGLLTLALGAKRKGDISAALAHALSARLESLKSRPFEDPALAAGSYASTTRIDPRGRDIDETWEIADDGDGLKRITIRVRAAERPGPGSTITAAAFVLRDLGFGP